MNYGSQVVATCEGVWDQVRENHTDLPDVIFTLGDGGGKVNGYFHGGAWHTKEDRTGKPQVLIAGERLAAGPEGVLETILHEAAHALAHAREIKDTSRQGRYHNKKYGLLAESVGLHVAAADATHGHTWTSLRPDTIERYARALHDLERVLTYYKRTPLPPRAKKKKEPQVQAECGCERKIPLAYLPVICGLCATEFEEVVNV